MNVILRLGFMLGVIFYVVLTDDMQMIDSLHPGPIDNSSLRASNENPSELRKGLVEGVDMILLPFDVAKMLSVKYGGKLEFARSIINIGTEYSPTYQINLYPIRIEAYLCDAKHPDPTHGDTNVMQKLYLNKRQTLQKAIDEAQIKFSLFTSIHKVRIWLRDRNPQADDMQDGEKDGGRLLTAARTGRHDDWQLLRDRYVAYIVLIDRSDC